MTPLGWLGRKTSTQTNNLDKYFVLFIIWIWRHYPCTSVHFLYGTINYVLIYISYLWLWRQILVHLFIYCLDVLTNVYYLLYECKKSALVHFYIYLWTYWLLTNLYYLLYGIEDAILVHLYIYLWTNGPCIYFYYLFYGSEKSIPVHLYIYFLDLLTYIIFIIWL